MEGGEGLTSRLFRDKHSETTRTLEFGTLPVLVVCFVVNRYKIL